MFKFFSKPKKEEVDLSIIGTDMHSHLIPGIDDGAQDVVASLELIKGMMELGYKKLITTPHIMWDMYKNTPKTIFNGLERLRKAIQLEGLTVEIQAAAEYFLDDHMGELLNKKEQLLTISGKMVLVEFSMAFPSFSIKNILFDMQMQGYQPILAHPERYIYLENAKDFYDELKGIGCLFQVNLLSLTGYYGKSVTELAYYLIKKGYYNLAGTDLHNMQQLQRLHDSSLAVGLKKLLESCTLINDQL
ncbi:MAG TPA: CpsB/CapC family capsule biosynthesis tyrosine phosphatase [Chitinophagaceae bacterium]|nr:CpsB/CapC family capsule biosynthesis tyrosine phosphatase [Chitinophagaceae bacterium]